MSDPLNPLLELLGEPSDSPKIESFLQRHRIHDRPKTPKQLMDEGVFDDEDEDEMDIEYEIEQLARASMIIESERYGFCLIFVPREDYVLSYGGPLPHSAPFILKEVAFFEKGVQIYQQYQGALPGNVRFGIRRDDPSYQGLGAPIAERTVYDCLTDLFVIDNRIVNYGFDSDDLGLLHVHVRQLNTFDRVMLSPQRNTTHGHTDSTLGAQLIGLLSSDPSVHTFLLAHDTDEDDATPGSCPEEITDLTTSLGITIYFGDSREGQRVGSITYKRRGDLGSQGYTGPLPYGFNFGDTPQTLSIKANGAPIEHHQSDQLGSLFWELESGFLMQAVCSLIDWQLYRVTIHAPFTAAKVVQSVRKLPDR